MLCYTGIILIVIIVVVVFVIIIKVLFGPGIQLLKNVLLSLTTGYNFAYGQAVAVVREPLGPAVGRKGQEI
jgi:hypothetical protein